MNEVAVATGFVKMAMVEDGIASKSAHHRLDRPTSRKPSPVDLTRRPPSTTAPGTSSPTPELPLSLYHHPRQPRRIKPHPLGVTSGRTDRRGGQSQGSGRKRRWGSRHGQGRLASTTMRWRSVVTSSRRTIVRQRFTRRSSALHDGASSTSAEERNHRRSLGSTPR